MTRVMLFLHILGFILWMGGAWALMVSSIVARREERAMLGPLVRMQAGIANALVGPGAGITVATGLILTFRVFGRGAAAPGGWVMVMQGAGLLAAVLTLAFTLPASARLRRMNPVGPHAAVFDELRTRQRVVGSVSGVLALLALLGGVMARFG